MILVNVSSTPINVVKTILNGGVYMVNEDITKYNNMIYKVINKYKSRYHDIDDLYQIGAIGVIYAYESYNLNSNTAFDTWVYNCIKWQVLRALRLDVKNNNVKEISIYSDVAEGEDIQIIDMLEDTSVNVYNTVENICMKELLTSLNAF